MNKFFRWTLVACGLVTVVIGFIFFPDGSKSNSDIESHTDEEEEEEEKSESTSVNV